MQIILHPQEIKLYKNVLETLKLNNNLRVHSGNHSSQFYNKLYETNNHIDITQYVIPPTFTNSILTSSAGHTFDYLRNFLSESGYKLRGTPESKYITLGGAVLNGIHNGSFLNRCISEYVTKMLMIDGNGILRILNDKNDIINFGTYGVVFRISIKCFKAENIKWTRTVFDNIDDIVITPDTHSLVFGPYSGKILQSKINETKEKPKSRFSRVVWDFFHSFIETYVVSSMTRALLYIIPSTGIIISESWLSEPDVIKDKYDYFEYVPFNNVYTMEYGIDLDYLKPIYKELMDLISYYRKHGTYVSYRFWLRLLEKSDLIYSLSYGKDTGIIEFTFSNDQTYSESFASYLNKIFLKNGGIPHMGKTIINESAVSNYDFTYLKNNINIYDPNKKFQNSFIRNILN